MIDNCTDYYLINFRIFCDVAWSLVKERINQGLLIGGYLIRVLQKGPTRKELSTRITAYEEAQW